MKVRILQVGIYSDFETQPGKSGAQTLSAGTVINYPEWYGQSLIDSGLAEPYSEPGVVDATEAAVKLAVDLGLVLYDIQGTGKDGRITVQDVRAAIDGEH